MKFYLVYSLFVFCAFLVVVSIALRDYALLDYVGNRVVKYAVEARHLVMHDNATHDSVTQDNATAYGSINLQEFVFFNAAELVNFEHKKNERARRLLEQLCGGKPTDAERTSTRIALRVIAMRNNVFAHSRQQFGIPQVVGKNELVKKIAITQLSAKKIAPQKQCMLSALEKLLE